MHESGNPVCDGLMVATPRKPEMAAVTVTVSLTNSHDAALWLDLISQVTEIARNPKYAEILVTMSGG